MKVIIKKHWQNHEPSLYKYNKESLLKNIAAAIKKAKHNMDKIKDVDKHIDSIR